MKETHPADLQKIVKSKKKNAFLCLEWRVYDLLIINLSRKKDLLVLITQWIGIGMEWNFKRYTNCWNNFCQCNCIFNKRKSKNKVKNSAKAFLLFILLNMYTNFFITLKRVCIVEWIIAMLS